MNAVREFNDLADLRGYRHVWNDLLGRTPGASFFQSLDWLETYWAHFAADQRLRVLLVGSPERWIGILPLVIRKRHRKGLGSLRILTYPLDDWGSFYGPIGTNKSATLLLALDHVRRTERAWDLIELPWVDALGDDAGDTQWALDRAGFHAIAERWQTSAIVDLAAYHHWEAYWASRTARWRNNVRRSAKKLAQHGEVSYFRYRPAG